MDGIPGINDDRDLVLLEKLPAEKDPDLALAAARGNVLIIQDAHVLPTDKQEVRSEPDGKLLFIATEVKLGEVVPEKKKSRAVIRSRVVEVPLGEEVPCWGVHVPPGG
jgi:hypothetical protein